MTGTLVIWDVDRLNRMQQDWLLRWMDRRFADVQIVSVAEHPVFPLVLREEFLATLYYRLNVVCLAEANSVEMAVAANAAVSGG